jgi:hypothetical protein
MEEATEPIVDGRLQILFTAKVPLGSQHEHVTKQELDLFQFAAIHMAELSAGSTEIVWRKTVHLHACSDSSHHVPNHVLGDLRAPGRLMAANSSEDSARRHLCQTSPVIDSILHPNGHRNGTDMIAFADEVHNRPMSLSDL